MARFETLFGHELALQEAHAVLALLAGFAAFAGLAWMRHEGRRVSGASLGLAPLALALLLFVLLVWLVPANVQE